MAHHGGNKVDVLHMPRFMGLKSFSFRLIQYLVSLRQSITLPITERHAPPTTPWEITEILLVAEKPAPASACCRVCSSFRYYRPAPDSNAPILQTIRRANVKE